MKDPREKWRKESLKMMGDKKDEYIKSINSLLKSSLSRKRLKKFREAMDATGAGDHPALIKLLYELSKKKRAT